MSRGAEDFRHQATFYVLLFGCAGTGKTSFVNVATGGEAEIKLGLRGTTRGMMISETFYVDDKSIVLIDFPGFNDAHSTGMEVLRCLAELPATLFSKNYEIAGFLYMHNITDTRVGGSSLRSMNVIKAICGTESFKNIVYVTNMWSNPPTKSEIKREQELRDSDDFFGEALSLGAQMARHTGSKESAHTIIRSILSNKPLIPKLLIQLVDERLPLEETDAAHALVQDFQRNDSYRSCQQELADLKDIGIGSSRDGRLQQPEATAVTYPSIPIIIPPPDLGHFMKIQGSESERSKHDSDRMNKSWLEHQEKTKRQEEQIARHIANIGSLAPTQQQDRPTSNSSVMAMLHDVKENIIGSVTSWTCGLIPYDSSKHQPIVDRDSPPQVDPPSQTPHAPEADSRSEDVRNAFQPRNSP